MLQEKEPTRQDSTICSLQWNWFIASELSFCTIVEAAGTLFKKAMLWEY